MRILLILAICLLLFSAVSGVAETPSQSPTVDRGSAGSEDAEQIRQQFGRLVHDLDSAQYPVRQQAADDLRRLASRPEAASVLAAEIQKLLVSPDISFEARRRLEPLRAALPEMAIVPPKEAAPEELERLVRQLEDDVYGRRLAAMRRLEWLLCNPKLVCPILLRLKTRMESDRLTLDARRWLEPIWRNTRAAWLTSDPAEWKLPAVSDAQITQWIDDLVRPIDNTLGARAEHAQQRAERELRDVLARDEYIDRVKKGLETRRGEPLGAQAATRIKRLLDLTEPAMVAECWGSVSPKIRCRMIGAQHLIVGVPSLGPGAERPSHFDRIDDQTAHCVSGQNLTPGEYPVGVAFPHPKQPGYLFQLVNLASPRRQMAYEVQSQVSQAKRLVELSRRTFAWMLARKKSLTVGELRMLGHLDPAEVSRFAGRFMELVADEPIPDEEVMAVADAPIPFGPAGHIAPPRSRAGRLSRHGMLCEMLIADGTREAIPGLLRAIEGGRILPPSRRAPYRLPWIAALAIGARDPWSGIDVWLAGLVGRTESLAQSLDGAPELGATSAALLLTRHRQELAAFGLKAIEDPVLQSGRLTGYRFTSPEARARVQEWWTQRKLGTASTMR